MSKKKKSVKVTTITSMQQFNSQKERYNPYQIGHGVWNDKRYKNRKTIKDSLKRKISKEEY